MAIVDADRSRLKTQTKVPHIDTRLGISRFVTAKALLLPHAPQSLGLGRTAPPNEMGCSVHKSTLFVEDVVL